MEVYHHTTDSSGGCSAQDPGKLHCLAVTGEAACLTLMHLTQNKMLKYCRDVLLESSYY